jgi:orotate phosphoribosyltransferase
LNRSSRISELAALLAERSLQVGTFTLASGRTSSYYIDARRTTMCAHGLELIGALGLAEIRAGGWAPDSVGGLTLGADPIAYAIARASREDPPTVDAFTVRKVAKQHGAQRQIEGCWRKGSSVVVVEDVVTTGQSALKAAEVVSDAGAVVLGILALVDRAEGGRVAIEERGYRLRCLLTLADLGVGS